MRYSNCRLTYLNQEYTASLYELLTLSLFIITIQCTQQCGGGRRQRSLTCVDSKTNVELSSSEYNAFKPSENEPCNLQDCEYIHELIALPITLLIEH